MIGSNHPTWVAYAKKFGLEFNDIPESGDSTPVVIDGKLLTDEETEPLWEELEKIQARITKDARPVVQDQPWKTRNAKALDQRTVAEALSSIKAPELAMKLMTAEIVADQGPSADHQSYLGLLAQVKGGDSANIGPSLKCMCVRAAISSSRRSLLKRLVASASF